ncbi:MAG: 2,3-bisphosphoglycerate-independent phosphoglycerate mutase [Bdellovibrionota bacterium]
MKALLIILDGFGHSEKHEHNAIYMAKTPTIDSLMKTYPHSLLKNSGEAVGLPEGIMGNSEVGHLNLGAGRVVYQELTRINKFIREKGFHTLPDIQRIAQNPMGALHFIGLLSDGGVHSDQKHLLKLVESVRTLSKDKPIFIHVITDGRDTPPKSGIDFVKELQHQVDLLPNVQIATVVGRFYAMDRDQRWERVEIAYKALTQEGSVEEFDSAEEAVLDAYKKEETDEFILPRQIRGGVRISPQDQVMFFNYRADRAREISLAIAGPGFDKFTTPVKVFSENWVTMTRYQKDFPFRPLFDQDSLKNILGEIVSQKGFKQLRVAETEKYAHVTYFFNGGLEKAFDGEDRILIPSPKEVKTYDEKPEMSAFEVTDKLLEGMDKDYKLIVVNYANGDMVGHTGNEQAAIKAVETLDKCVEKLVSKAQARNFDVIITADHGNCEEMISETGEAMTQHSMNPVPCILVSEKHKNVKMHDGALCDVAPTILKLFNWEKPADMSGNPLF